MVRQLEAPLCGGKPVLGNDNIVGVSRRCVVKPRRCIPGSRVLDLHGVLALPAVTQSLMYRVTHQQMSL